MSGNELKEKLKSTNLSINEIGRRLGMSSQSICQALEAKDIKTGFLEKLCAILEVDMSFFYPSSGTAITNNIRRQSAHNLHQGEGNIVENAGGNDALTLALQQNAELIALLKAEKGL